MAVTLDDIAKRVGVKKSTVSLVLNNKRGAIRISDKTRDGILRVARELGYHPNAAARALATNRTGHLGFILSDAVTDGWANAYFADFLAGVESACRRFGYGLSVSRYNLSSIKSFVFPERVGQRSVDGLVLSGFIEHAVLQQFQEFGIPCVCLGQDTELAEDVPTISANVLDGWIQVVRYARKLHHRRIGLCIGDTRDTRRVLGELKQVVAEDPDLADCQLMDMAPQGVQYDYYMGEPLFGNWYGMPASQRPTLMVSNDQVLLGFLKVLQQAGMRCPEDVSLVSGCDSRLCEFSSPALSALLLDRRQLGELAVQVLVDHLDNHKPLVQQPFMNEFSFNLIGRESCMPLGKGGEKEGGKVGLPVLDARWQAAGE